MHLLLQISQNGSKFLEKFGGMEIGAETAFVFYRDCWHGCIEARKTHRSIYFYIFLLRVIK
jgi:hypothetical protein